MVPRTLIHCKRFAEARRPTNVNKPVGLVEAESAWQANRQHQTIAPEYLQNTNGLVTSGHGMAAAMPREGFWSLPADQVTRRLIAEGSISDESDAGVEEGGGGDAEAGGLLHLGVLARALDGVLQRMDYILHAAFSRAVSRVVFQA